ncbi:MAG: hypothetical protein RL625_844 [Gemmatimonadota bacterium]|jgi:hypothetical protein
MPLLRPTAVMTAIDLDEELEAKQPLLQKLALNVVFMAMLTGFALRVYRNLILNYGWSDSWFWIAGTFLGQVAILFLLTTLYLGNYHAKSWLWRAPLFATIVAATEVAVSYGMLRAGLERIGSLPATFEDWQGLAIRLITVRLTLIPLYALALAIVSTVVRWLILPREKPSLPSS